MHGGTIEAASAGEGWGATFKVTLPVRRHHAARGGRRRAVYGQKLRELAGVRALVVDDEDDARELIETVLTQYGAEVVAASSAAEAYMLITATQPQWRPDVMVTDIGMPGEDGYSLIRRVREWERVRGALLRPWRLRPTGESRPDARAERRLPNACRQAGRACRTGRRDHLVRRPNSGERRENDSSG